MVKWKLFKKSEEESDFTDIETCEEPEDEEEILENTPLVEYNETLHTNKKIKPKTKKKTQLDDDSSGYIEGENSDQRVWRDIKTIEENIDNLHVINAVKPKTNLDKTVEDLIQKNKKK